MRTALLSCSHADIVCFLLVFPAAIQIVGKMRISERLNVVRINASNANGRHNNSELLLPQDEPAIETQTIGEDDIHVEQQDYDDLNVSSKTVTGKM